MAIQTETFTISLELHLIYWIGMVSEKNKLSSLYYEFRHIVHTYDFFNLEFLTDLSGLVSVSIWLVFLNTNMLNMPSGSVFLEIFEKLYKASSRKVLLKMSGKQHMCISISAKLGT